MDSRRYRPANRFGCKVFQDVCIEHSEPLECRHGCGHATEHKCKDKEGVAAAIRSRATLSTGESGEGEMRDRNCDDCGGFDLEWMNRCLNHKTEFCRGCGCPDCREEANDIFDDSADADYINHGNSSGMAGDD